MLPPATEKVWDFLRTQPSLHGFVLIGGSALAMHLQHRFSEDLDFAWVGTRLPRPQISALLAAAKAASIVFVRNDNQQAYEEFFIGGMDLHDSQQDFLVNDSVKVTFITPDQDAVKVLGGVPAADFRIATVEELFRLKSLVAAVRSTIRDWFDLYTLLREYGYTLRDVREVFLEFSYPGNWDTAVSRMCSGHPNEGDPGLASLLSDPPTVEQMRDYFRAERDRLEVELAAEAKRARLEIEGRSPNS